MKNSYFLLIGLLIFFLVGCSKSLDDKPTYGYAPGELIIWFDDGATEEQANSLINSYNLGWKPGDNSAVSIWVKVISGSKEEHIASLEESNLVSWAEERANNILVMFQDNITVKAANELINSFDGLEVLSVNQYPVWGVVIVPEGEEEKWTETFKREPIVNESTLNYYESLAGSSSNVSESCPEGMFEPYSGYCTQLQDYTTN